MNRKELNFTVIFTWVIVCIILIISLLAIWLLRTPQQIIDMLQKASLDLKNYAVIVHILFIFIFLTGIFLKKIRNIIFPILMIYLSISATVVAVLYKLLPNIIIYGLYCVLIFFSLIKKEFDFEFKKISWLSLIFGLFGIIMGFWYLHWIEKPIMLNALFFSPVGILNCPTMITICGFLILNTNSKLYLLEFVVGLSTLWIGFFGIFALDAYIDIFLIIVALFILMRIGYYLSFNKVLIKR
jgi:hypothetical protein